MIGREIHPLRKTGTPCGLCCSFNITCSSGLDGLCIFSFVAKVSSLLYARLCVER